MQTGRQNAAVAVMVLALAGGGLPACPVKTPTGTKEAEKGKPVKPARDGDSGPPTREKKTPAATCPAYFVNTTAFRIPFVVAKDRVEAASVILYVSTDRGRTYQKVMKAKPGEMFKYHSAGDGLYFFAVQLVQADGRLDPPTMKDADPSMIVGVDTRAPSVKLEVIREDGRGIRVKWRVKDESLSLYTLQIDLRIPGRPWVPYYSLKDSAFERDPGQTSEEGEIVFNLADKEAVEIRLRVKDGAGNCAEQIATLKARK